MSRFAATAPLMAELEESRRDDLRARLRRFATPRGDERALDAGTGVGAVAFALAPLVEEVVAVDAEPVLLELARQRSEEFPNVSFVEGDVTALPVGVSGFDLTCCVRVLHHVARPELVVAELVRVTRPGGHVLVSVMSLAGTVVHFLPILVDLARRDGVAKNEAIVRTGLLPDETDYGHLAMKLFRWPELEALLSPHGTIVDACAAGLLPSVRPEEPELRAFLSRTELALADDPGTIGCGQHILAVLQRDA